MIISSASSFDRTAGSAVSLDTSHSIKNDKLEHRIFNEAINEISIGLIRNEAWEQLEGLSADAKYEKLNEIYTQHYITAYPLNTN